jgi:membrane protease YdiL (CAAX protease family)
MKSCEGQSSHEDLSNPSEILNPAGKVRPRIFIGPNGIRAGWRLLIFAAIFSPLYYAADRILDSLMHRVNVDPYSPLGITIGGGVFAVAVFLANWIMARIEGRSIADYGLPWRRALCRQYWQGAAISFASLTIFLLVLHLAGAFSFGSPTLHGADIWKYGAIWAVPMFLGTLLEDFFYRGYLLFTLTTGIGFWPAAITTSLFMGGMHYLNPGGHGLGPIATTEYCLVTCLVIRRTGDLWMALGIHWAWDWGAVFFYGMPSGGFTGHPHFLNATFHGSQWLTGGTFGPEGSLPNIALLAIWGLGFALWLRRVKYPNPAAVPDPRRRVGS